MGQTNAPHRTISLTDLSLMSTLITLSDVSFSYDHRRTILSDISLSIAEQDFIVLRGKNGGGKTSLLKIIAGLLSPTSGTIERANALTGLFASTSQHRPPISHHCLPNRAQRSAVHPPLVETFRTVGARHHNEHP